MELGLTVTQLLRREVRRSRPGGLSLPQFRALAIVGARRAASPSELAEDMGLAPATTSAIADRLVEAGLMVREPPETDRRRRVLALSPQGRRELNAGLRTLREHLAGYLGPLSTNDREKVTMATNLVRAHLGGLGPRA